MSPERKNKIQQYRFDKDKILSLYSASMIYTGLSEILYCPIKDLCFIQEHNHKPKLNPACHKNASLIDFSISHTDNAVLTGIVSGCNIGVDIESIKNAPFDVMPIVFHKEEIDYINSSNPEERDKRFFEIWTKKEAYTKCIGTGLVCDLTSINTLKLPFYIMLITKTIDDYIYSVAVSSGGDSLTKLQ